MFLDPEISKELELWNQEKQKSVELARIYIQELIDLGLPVEEVIKIDGKEYQVKTSLDEKGNLKSLTVVGDNLNVSLYSEPEQQGEDPNPYSAFVFDSPKEGENESTLHATNIFLKALPEICKRLAQDQIDRLRMAQDALNSYVGEQRIDTSITNRMRRMFRSKAEAVVGKNTPTLNEVKARQVEVNAEMETVFEVLKEIRIRFNELLADFKREQFAYVYKQKKEVRNKTTIADSVSLWFSIVVNKTQFVLEIKELHTHPENSKGMMYVKDDGYLKSTTVCLTYDSATNNFLEGHTPKTEEAACKFIMYTRALLKQIKKDYRNKKKKANQAFNTFK